jgi:hypothetical protein
MAPVFDDIEVRAIVEEEGIGYAVMHYMPASYCKNPETAKLWKEASDALSALKRHLHLFED